MKDKFEEQLEELTARMDVLKKEVEIISHTNEEIVQILGQFSDVMQKQELKISTCYAYVKNAFYEMKAAEDDYVFPIIRPGEEAIDQIISERKSLARFGDGEFSQIFGLTRQPFQRLDETLGHRLLEVLHSKEENLLVAIADNYGSLEKYNDSIAIGIRDYMTRDDNRRRHAEVLEKNRIYYDAYLTRPYVIYADQNTDAPKRRFDRLKEIWKNREVIMVEGAQTRLGVGNDLFAGCASIKRIEAPATSSFDCYEEILKAALQYGKKETLFLIALGPAAGVLAYDLSKAGYQALDIGHVDLEYEWFLAGKGERVPVPGKYNNEIEGGHLVQECLDESYRSQIIAEFL